MVVEGKIEEVAVEDSDVRVELELQDGYRFAADLGVPGAPPLVMDEPEPLGEGSGPNAARVLAAAVGNCLSASALFCLKKARIEVKGMHTEATARIERNDEGRSRIERIEVRIEPQVAERDLGRLDRCLAIFEDYCIVTQSVRRGITVDVEVEPRTTERAA